MCFWLGTEAAFAEECWLVSGRYHFSCLFKLQKILISKHFSLHRTYLFLISAFCWHNFPFLPAGSVYGMIHQAVSASPSSPSAARGFPGEPWAAGCSLSPCGRGRKKAAQATMLISATATLRHTECNFSRWHAPIATGNLTVEKMAQTSSRPDPARMPELTLQFCFQEVPLIWEKWAQEVCLNVYNMPICVEHVKSQMVSHGR